MSDIMQVVPVTNLIILPIAYYSFIMTTSARLQCSRTPEVNTHIKTAEKKRKLQKLKESEQPQVKGEGGV